MIIACYENQDTFFFLISVRDKIVLKRAAKTATQNEDTNMQNNLTSPVCLMKHPTSWGISIPFLFKYI